MANCETYYYICAMLKIYQVYYNDEQLSRLDFTPYLNSDCTEFFENSVIAKLVPECKDEYVGIVSWDLRRKLANPLGPFEFSLLHIPSLESMEFEIKEWNADVFGFIKYKDHNPVTHFCGIHLELEQFFKRVCVAIGMPYIPAELPDVFYSNHFVAKTEIYKAYVKNALIPAMNFMRDHMPELWKDSGYPKLLPIELRVKWGITHYPYFPFILERLFSYYCFNKELSVKYF